MAFIGVSVQGSASIGNKHNTISGSVPNFDFKNYGYPGDDIPRDLSQFKPVLLHEESVLHVLNHKQQFKLLNKGFTAKLYEGRMRFTGQKVAVKKLTDGDYDAVLSEATLTAYLQGNSHIPNVQGILPHGVSLDDLALVIDFLDNSTTLGQLVDDEDPLSECDWLNIAQQAVSTLDYIHSKYVLFNDLHEDNLLITWRGSLPHLYIIDFGLATFRKGACFSHIPIEKRHTGDFLAPEVFHGLSTPASDVYSLGDMLLMMSKFIESLKFYEIARKCNERLSKDRPTLKQAKAGILKIYRDTCYEYMQSVKNNMDWVQEPAVDGNTPIDLFSGRSPSVAGGDATQPNVLSSKLPIITSEFLKERTYVQNWKSFRKDTTYSLAYYSGTNATVVVKCDDNAVFEDIRHEAYVSYVMSSSGYVPTFLGLTSSENLMEDLCIVQESMTNTTVLADVLKTITHSRKYVKVALALELSKALLLFHQHGHILNCMDPQNILFEIKDDYPVIKFKDIGKGIGTGHVLHASHMTHGDSPEMPQKLAVTSSSDVYSLGGILQSVFDGCSDHAVASVITNCLSASPLDRPSAEEIHAFFERMYSNGQTWVDT
ncbi:uncharacterized protein [Haliotis cracherodii]|uniref:uncharacterized protein n=1 Tax=Haliotis cracherodii TaxID=6455 RepID=UPI0039EBC875